MTVSIVYIAALGIGDLKFHASQRLAGYFILFLYHQRSGLLIDKSQILRLALFNENGFWRAVQNIAVNRGNLSGGDTAARLNIGKYNPSAVVRPVFAVGIAHRCAILVGNEEFNPSQRFIFSSSGKFLHHQRCAECVIES